MSPWTLSLHPLPAHIALKYFFLPSRKDKEILSPWSVHSQDISTPWNPWLLLRGSRSAGRPAAPLLLPPPPPPLHF